MAARRAQQGALAARRRRRGGTGTATQRAHYGPANTAELYEDEKKLAVVRAEPNIRLFLEHRVNAVETDGGTHPRGRRAGDQHRPAACASPAAGSPTARATRRSARWRARISRSSRRATWGRAICGTSASARTPTPSTPTVAASRAAAVPALPVGARPDRQAVPRPQQDQARHRTSSAAGTGRAASIATRSPRWSTSATGTSARCTARGTR